MPSDPFALPIPSGPPLRRAAFAAARPLLSWVVKAGKFRDLYRHVDHEDAERFALRALRLLEIEADCAVSDLSLVPRKGPLIVTANHPHGALDGLLLAAVLARVRGDVRLVANHLLARIPELRDSCFFVDPFAGPMAAVRSRAGLRAAHLWLREGGTLVIFPAGEVAHERRHDGSAIDSPWNAIAARMALHTGAQVLPAFIPGSNSGLFYAAGRLHRVLRTALLARELLKKRGCRTRVRFGQPLSFRPHAAMSGDPEAATARMRAAVERLAEERQPAVRLVDTPDSMAAEIAQLPRDSCLVENGAFKVFCAEAVHIPAVLQEIGRLRAVTFQAVGEGTGGAIDLDAFDERYLHLFLWDSSQRCVAGAYRIGRTDRIMPAHGVEGLYTRTLFRYDRRFIERISPALELGRSFVRSEYQRHHNSLLMLWKGIGRFVTRHPAYRVLFGPVSISTRYSDSSHAMLAAFLEQNHLDAALAELVQAINPVVLKRALGAAVPRTLDAANQLVSKLEADGKGMPVLLRQYLKLNARLIGFNVDAQFGDVLDALMMVDLATLDPAILARYLGRHEAAQFLARHRSRDTFQAA